MAWSKRARTRIELQRARNANQGRPVYRGTGKRKRTCPGLTVLAAGMVAQFLPYFDPARWLS
jgi:hypothetical protein